MALAAADLAEYAASIENTILRMRLSGGCSDTQISFETPLDGAAYAYEHAPPSPAGCMLFDTAGGGIPYREDKNWYDQNLYASYIGYATWFTGSLNVQNIGSAASDLVMYVYPLSKDVCNAINSRLGIIYSGDPPVADSTSSGVSFQGIYQTNADNIADSPGSLFAGQPAGCMYNASVPNYFFYKVILPR